MMMKDRKKVAIWRGNLESLLAAPIFKRRLIEAGQISFRTKQETGFLVLKIFGQPIFFIGRIVKGSPRNVSLRKSFNENEISEIGNFIKRRDPLIKAMKDYNPCLDLYPFFLIHFHPDNSDNFFSGAPSRKDLNVIDKLFRKFPIELGIKMHEEIFPIMGIGRLFSPDIPIVRLLLVQYTPEIDSGETKKVSGDLLEDFKEKLKKGKLTLLDLMRMIENLMKKSIFSLKEAGWNIGEIEYKFDQRGVKIIKRKPVESIDKG